MRSFRALPTSLARRLEPADNPVDRYIAGLKPPVRGIAEALRRTIRAAAPELEETLKWDAPTYVGKAPVCYIAGYLDHVNLGFHRGAELRDPKGLLEGTGKRLRHVKVRSEADANSASVVALVREAARLERA